MTQMTNPQIVTDELLRSVGRALASHQTPLILSHERPDPDALGCLIAMNSVLRQLGKRPIATLFEPCPRRYRFLPEIDQLVQFDEVVAGLSCDCILIVDTCAAQQIRPAVQYVNQSNLPKFVVDHHITRDLAIDHLLIDETASAASLVVYRWIKAMDWPLSTSAATALLAGIIGDTGWFRFDNTDASTLRIAADLLEIGVDLDWLHQKLHQSEPASTLRLRAAALGALRFHRNETIATVPMSKQLFADTGAAGADAENIVNEALCVESVRASVVLVEMEGGLIKCSFRSKGDIDVAAVARSFGGGGHARAAGARIEGSLEDVEQKVVQCVTEFLDRQSPG